MARTKKNTQTAVKPAPQKSPSTSRTAAKVKASAVQATPVQGNGGQGPATSVIAPQVVTTLSHDDIARKAYEIWVAKGRPTGMDEQNWREAEQALRTR